MELLSPAGNIQNAYSAFKAGADAIYIGGKSFSARAAANNFTNEEIKEIVFFAHSIGKKVYVTLNTIIFQDEFFVAVEFANFLYSIDIDGIIIQDLGLARYLHKTLPLLPLNASTQLNCHNIDEAKALMEIGFKRIVMAREADIATIKEVKDLGVEVEVFAHGALCVSYSGNCLMSSLIGDRSGNRGRCAQPCRMRYKLLEDKKEIDDNFMISTKDLMTLDYLDEFIALGVDSIKIEGRLKSNEYIYSVTKAYRHSLDKCLLPHDKESLYKTFTREFTKGYVLGENPFNLLNTESSSHKGEVIGKVVRINKNRVTIRLDKPLHRLDGIRFLSKEQFGLAVEKMFLNKEAVEEAKKGDYIELINIEKADRLLNLEVIKTKDYLLNKEIEEQLKNNIKVPVKGKFFAFANAPISLTLSFNGHTVTVKGNNALEAENNGTSKERILEQLNKSGEYPYYIEDLETKMNKCFIPISHLNDLKRKAYQELLDSFKNEKEVNPLPYVNEYFEHVEINKSISAFVENIEQLETVNNNGLRAYHNKGDIYHLENRISHHINDDKPYNVIHFPIIKNSDNYLIASEHTNIVNSYAIDAYYSLGFNEIILSTELDQSSINALIKDYANRHGTIPNVGMLIYGKVDMMIMRSCPIGTHYKNKNIHCNRCHHQKYELQDHIGEKYTLIGDSNCNVRVLCNKCLYLFDRFYEIKDMGVTNIYLLFTDEGEERMEEILDDFNNKKDSFNRFKYTRGHYNKRPE